MKSMEIRSSLLEIAEEMSGELGYEDTKLNVRLWDGYKIKPIIDIRNM